MRLRASSRRNVAVGLVAQFSSFFAPLGVEAWRAKEKRSQSVILMTPTLFWHGFSWFQGLPWAPFGSSFGGFLVLLGWHRSTFCSKVAPAKDRCGSGCAVFFFFGRFAAPKPSIITEKGRFFRPGTDLWIPNACKNHPKTTGNQQNRIKSQKSFRKSQNI